MAVTTGQCHVGYAMESVACFQCFGGIFSSAYIVRVEEP